MWGSSSILQLSLYYTNSLGSVHVAIERGPDTDLSSPLGFECQKNVVVLYGLFEDDIGRWLPVKRRDATEFTSRVRHGMEADLLPLWDRQGDDGADGADEYDPIRFVPQLFTQKNLRRNFYGPADKSNYRTNQGN